MPGRTLCHSAADYPLHYRNRSRADHRRYQFKLVSAVGETDDQIFVWLPESQTLCCGDNFYPCWPNLSAIRGSQYRDVSAWIDSLDAMRAYPAEALLPGHGKATHGYTDIQEVLKNYRDAIEFVLLQTLEGMNQGKTVDELAASITLPEHLKQLPYLGEHYGTVAWSVRGIFAGYAGWFDGNPTHLNPLPPQEEADKLLAMIGGVANVFTAIQQAIAAQQYQWAMQLCDILLHSQQEIQQTSRYKAQCCLALQNRKPVPTADITTKPAPRNCCKQPMPCPKTMNRTKNQRSSVSLTIAPLVFCFYKL